MHDSLGHNTCVSGTYACLSGTYACVSGTYACPSVTYTSVGGNDLATTNFNEFPYLSKMYMTNFRYVLCVITDE